LNVQPPSGTPINRSGKRGRDRNFRGSLLTINISGNAIIVALYIQTSKDSTKRVYSQDPLLYITGSKTAVGANGKIVANIVTPRILPKKWAGIIIVSFPGLILPNIASARRIGKSG